MKVLYDQDDLDKAARRPVPRTLTGWCGEIEGVFKFVSKRPKLNDDQGADWWQKTRRYYLARLQVLGENPPKSLPLKAARIIVREFSRTL